MAINYTWIFNPLEVALSQDGLTNVVTTVHWRLIASETVGDVEYSESVYGSEGMDPPVPANFVDYEELDQATVQEWIEGKMGAERVQQLKDSLASQINAKKNPVSATLPAPWA